jgi:hypothetical protein
LPKARPRWQAFGMIQAHSSEADERYLSEIRADCLDESAGVGESMLAAHSALRSQIVLDRIRLSLSAIVQSKG